MLAGGNGQTPESTGLKEISWLNTMAFDKLTKRNCSLMSTGKTEEKLKTSNYSRSTRNAPKWEAGDEAVKSLWKNEPMGV
jgi:hypothetical protein